MMEPKASGSPRRSRTIASGAPPSASGFMAAARIIAPTGIRTKVRKRPVPRPLPYGHSSERAVERQPHRGPPKGMKLLRGGRPHLRRTPLVRHAEPASSQGAGSLVPRVSGEKLAIIATYREAHTTRLERRRALLPV